MNFIQYVGEMRTNSMILKGFLALNHRIQEKVSTIIRKGSTNKNENTDLMVSLLKVGTKKGNHF